jgi:hypothetical protein
VTSLACATADTRRVSSWAVHLALADRLMLWYLGTSDVGGTSPEPLRLQNLHTVDVVPGTSMLFVPCLSVRLMQSALPCSRSGGGSIRACWRTAVCMYNCRQYSLKYACDWRMENHKPQAGINRFHASSEDDVLVHNWYDDRSTRGVILRLRGKAVPEGTWSLVPLL